MKTLFFHSKKSTSNRGFALIIGVMVSAVLVSITYVMFSISLKQISLSTTGKNSQVAFYAADTGAECAIYADRTIANQFGIPNDEESGSSVIKSLTFSSPMPSFSCNNILISPTAVGGVIQTAFGQSPITAKFTVTYPGSNECAIVEVVKTIDREFYGSNFVDKVKTKIESRGYNTCLNLTDPQRVERGLEVHY
jgi:uncharacterized protein (UPF0333 family)